ncbi:MAG: hypothetical protein KA015_01400 [Spirochaetes bacterium]|nr:hypothetical protein [Spirochaetota bacterium]
MFLKKVVLFVSFISVFSCAGIEKKINNVQFALIANTRPDSAFKTNPAELARLIDSVNYDNPTFLIHLGNMIQGGSSKSGIIKNDVEKQLDSAKKEFSRFRSIAYFIPAEHDKFDGSFDLFNKRENHREYFSFNYGTLHFIVLNASNEGKIITEEQLIWLKSDIENYKNSGIIIFTKIPFFAPLKVKTQTISNSSETHSILAKYNIISVISSESDSEYDFVKEGIRHINLPILSIENKRNKTDYYIIQITDGKLSFEGKKIK